MDTVGVANDVRSSVVLSDTHRAVLFQHLANHRVTHARVLCDSQHLKVGERLEHRTHGAHKSAEETGDVRSSDHKSDHKTELDPRNDPRTHNGAGVPHGEPGDVGKESGGRRKGAERSVAEHPLRVVILDFLLLSKTGGRCTAGPVHKAPDEGEPEDSPLDIAELTSLFLGNDIRGHISGICRLLGALGCALLDGKGEGDEVLDETERAGPGAEKLPDRDGREKGDAEGEQGEFGMRETALEIVVGATDNAVRRTRGLEEGNGDVERRHAEETGVEQGEHGALHKETSNLDCLDHCVSVCVCVCLNEVY